MKVIAFLALLALTANAFNLTEYHLGVDAQKGFNDTVVQEGIDCLAALSSHFDQIVDIIESENFDNIAENLGSLIEDLKSDFNTTCISYFMAEAAYYFENTNASNSSVLKETIHENLQLYYPQIIQQVANWTDHLDEGYDYHAGEIQSYIGQILTGVVVPATIEVAPANVTVPLNASKFFDEYVSTIYEGLGINATVNVSALVQCNSNIQNLTLHVLHIKQNWTSLDFNGKLNAVQYLFGLVFETVRNCEGAAEVSAPIVVPQFEAFKQNPLSFTLDVLNRIAIDYPSYIASIQKQSVYIQEGDYVHAAQEKLDRLRNDFHGLVNYTTTN